MLVPFCTRVAVAAPAAVRSCSSPCFTCEWRALASAQKGETRTLAAFLAGAALAGAGSPVKKGVSFSPGAVS
jgi:hypothetical protein